LRAARNFKESVAHLGLGISHRRDEFALLLPQTDAEQALALSRRVETVSKNSSAMQLSVPRQHGSWRRQFPQDGEQADQLIRVADERLYRLKQANHNKTAGGSSRPTSSTKSETARSNGSYGEPGSSVKTHSIESKTLSRKTETTIAAAAFRHCAGISAETTRLFRASSPFSAKRTRFP